jgi:predicted nucleic acid-binding protein
MAIASCLVDTNILLRLTRRGDSQHKTVATAVARLLDQGATLYYTQPEHRRTPERNDAAC